MKSHHLFILFCGFIQLAGTNASAVELVGLIGYDASVFSNKPSNYSAATGGVGYSFFARTDLGPGMIESGALVAPNSITTNQSYGALKANGFYWILPLMYRLPIYAPFFSFAVGLDYAVASSTNFSVGGATLASTTNGYQNHFGAQVSVEAVQDLGENLGLVLDARYRQGLSSAITLNSAHVNYNFVMIGIGLQKRLE
jgi:hypothetical protein